MPKFGAASNHKFVSPPGCWMFCRTVAVVHSTQTLVPSKPPVLFDGRLYRSPQETFNWLQGLLKQYHCAHCPACPCWCRLAKVLAWQQQQQQPELHQCRRRQYTQGSACWQQLFRRPSQQRCKCCRLWLAWAATRAWDRPHSKGHKGVLHTSAGPMQPIEAAKDLALLVWPFSATVSEWAAVPLAASCSRAPCLRPRGERQWAGEVALKPRDHVCTARVATQCIRLPQTQGLQARVCNSLWRVDCVGWHVCCGDRRVWWTPFGQRTLGALWRPWGPSWPQTSSTYLVSMTPTPCA